MEDIFDGNRTEEISEGNRIGEIYDWNRMVEIYEGNRMDIRQQKASLKEDSWFWTFDIYLE